MATPAILPDQSAAPAPSAKPRLHSIPLAAVLFVVTFATTTLVGMRYAANFRTGRFPIASEDDILPFRWLAHNLSRWTLGLPFSLTLLAILLAHEFAHFGASRSYGIDTSLPYLVPAPSLSGTMGAIIRLRTRVPSRCALLHIGSSGPIAGFAVAAVTSAIGLRLSLPAAAAPPQFFLLNPPLLLRVLGHVLHVNLTQPLLWHPILIASWIGLLVTSLNLIPAGQLDGGHILYALSPEAHRRVTFAVIAALALLGIFTWVGWLLWMALLLIPAMRHPRVPDNTPVGSAHALLAPVCLVIFLLCATPTPFSGARLLDTLHWIHGH